MIFFQKQFLYSQLPPSLIKVESSDKFCNFNKYMQHNPKQKLEQLGFKQMLNIILLRN